jgi:Leucine-rich repeat (LRR) protein
MQERLLLTYAEQYNFLEKSYGDCIVARGIQTYWTKNQISLKNYQLDEIPPLLLKQTHLEALNLTQNRLKDLPIVSFNLLQLLDLSCNKLEGVPSAVFNLVNLRSLNLSSNNLTEIDSNINKLTNLVQLIFSDNKISKLPSHMDLPKLENLFGSKNNIGNQIWSSLTYTTSLLSLEMSHNNITSAIEATNFEALRILVLANNPLEDKQQLAHLINSKITKLHVIQI